MITNTYEMLNSEKNGTSSFQQNTLSGNKKTQVGQYHLHEG